MEHRCGFRRSASVPVIVRTQTGPGGEAEINNISASGALICGPVEASLHALVLIQFRRSGRQRLPRPVVAAEVVRHAPGGFAVEWTEFSPAAVRSILRDLSGEAASPPRSVTAHARS